MSLSIGDKAPAFSMPTDGGGEVSLAGLKGRPVVLYFYPRDDTPGCTTEACGFRDAMPDFSKVDAAIVGVSRDTVAKHDKFKAKYELPFTHGADETGAVTVSYEAGVPSGMYGKKSMGIERATFLIDGAGVIRGIWRKVKVNGHVDEVLAAVRAL